MGDTARDDRAAALEARLAEAASEAADTITDLTVRLVEAEDELNNLGIELAVEASLRRTAEAAREALEARLAAAEAREAGQAKAAFDYSIRLGKAEAALREARAWSGNYRTVQRIVDAALSPSGNGEGT
jgi:hypothetical protein